MVNIILIGFMGCGKSTFGKWLSDKQQMDFVDTDELIERLEGMTVNDIFKEKGEKYFRELETLTIKKLLGEVDSEIAINKSTVISVGGGLPVKEENRELLKKLGKVVFLDTSIDVLLKRLKGDNKRPLLKGSDLRGRIEGLMAERYDIYEDAADIILNTDNKTLYQIYEELLDEY